MTQIVVIMAILLIIVIIQFIAALANGAIEASNKIGRDLDEFGSRCLAAIGRKRAKLLEVAPILASGPPPAFISWKKRVSELKAWRPERPAMPKYDTAKYEPVRISASRKIQFDLLPHELDSILMPAQFSPSIYDLLKKAIGDSKYPVAAPSFPSAPEKPETIEPLLTEIPEPRLQLPLYDGLLAVLNYFVRDAYNEDLKQLRLAKQLREELLTTAGEANPRVVFENACALERWKIALKEYEERRDALLQIHAQAKTAFALARLADLAKIEAIHHAYRKKTPDGIAEHFNIILARLELPAFVPRKWRIQYDPKSRIMVLEHQFPDLARLQIDRMVSLKTGDVRRPALQRMRKELLAKIQPALSLRLAYEVAAHDYESVLDAITVNGWAEFIDRRTGEERIAYCSTLFAKRSDLLGLKLGKVDPLSAFRALRGNSANESYEVTPIAPIMRLDTSDPRFVAPRVVLGKMTEGENLAAMDWEEFEHLIRELFERAFSFPGAEVKITQASRDKGVDAVVFNPDPIQGGKIIIQAKRYTNTVDVSAVRDLYGAVLNEGAMKGILVTTSHYGTEAYSFVAGKPLSLMNGVELLGLLAKYGYKFRIDIDEARRLGGAQPPN